MQRSKQQAMMFLLGAVLVGGVLGFSADRLIGRFQNKENTRSTWFDRRAMYEDLGFSRQQMEQWEAMSDTTSCLLEEISRRMAPFRSEYDSVRRQRRRDLLEVLNPEQRKRFEARQQQFSGGGRGGQSGRESRPESRDSGSAASAGERRGGAGSGGTQPGGMGNSRAERAERCRAMLKERQ